VNLAGAHPDVARRLRDLLEAWTREVDGAGTDRPR
jgi:hypothetical protein